MNIHKKLNSLSQVQFLFSRNGTQKTSTSSGFSEEQQNESQSVCSDNSSNRSVDDKSDSGNDSDIKKVRKYNLVKYLWSFGQIFFEKMHENAKKYLEKHKYDLGD